jgi:hypothetical protein
MRPPWRLTCNERGQLFDDSQELVSLPRLRRQDQDDPRNVLPGMRTKCLAECAIPLAPSRGHNGNPAMVGIGRRVGPRCGLLSSCRRTDDAIRDANGRSRHDLDSRHEWTCYRFLVGRAALASSFGLGGVLAHSCSSAASYRADGMRHFAGPIAVVLRRVHSRDLGSIRSLTTLGGCSDCVDRVDMRPERATGDLLIVGREADGICILKNLKTLKTLPPFSYPHVEVLPRTARFL